MPRLTHRMSFCTSCGICPMWRRPAVGTLLNQWMHLRACWKSNTYALYYSHKMLRKRQEGERCRGAGNIPPIILSILLPSLTMMAPLQDWTHTHPLQANSLLLKNKQTSNQLLNWLRSKRLSLPKSATKESGATDSRMILELTLRSGTAAGKNRSR